MTGRIDLIATMATASRGMQQVTRHHENLHYAIWQFDDRGRRRSDICRWPDRHGRLPPWVLLADAENAALGWLQSLDRPEVALGVVSPRRFVPDYQVRVAEREIQPLGLENPNDAQVLVIVSHVGWQLSLNLKAPLVIHVAERLAGRLLPAMIMRCSIGCRRRRGGRWRRSDR